jgi:hypothetical protein
MPVPTARLKNLLGGRLDFYASKRWPQLEEVTIRWHGGYGYVTGFLPDDEELPHCRLRYHGSDTDWGFALYQASTETYKEALLPNGQSTGTPRMLSTAPLASTSPTQAPGSNPRRINAALH